MKRLKSAFDGQLKDFVEIKNKRKNSEPDRFVENIDYYFENGLMVLTARFLEKRGYCCSNDCRHCPYQKAETRDLQQESV